MSRAGVVSAMVLMAWAGAVAPAGLTLGVTELEIVPSKVIVGTDPTQATTFELEARVWKGTVTERYTAIKGEDYDGADWKVDRNWIHVVKLDDTLASVTVDAATPAGTATVEVKVTGGKTATATITVVDGTVSPSQDLVRAKYTGKAPAAGIVNGMLPGATDCTTTIFAFVRFATIPDMEKACGGKRSGWEAAVLDPDYQAAFVSAAWRTGTNIVDAAPAQAVPLDIPIAIRVMYFDSTLTAQALASSRQEALALAQNDIDYANDVLSKTRAGIRVSPQDARIIPVSAAVAFSTCAEGEYQTSPYDMAHVLHVYYVNKYDDTKGFTCVATGTRPRDVIYISRVNSPSTLTHEVGHSLGLVLPGDGHTSALGGFDATNVMHSGDEPQDGLGRHRLTVAQVFRINADSASWLYRGSNVQGQPLRVAPAPLDCPCSVGGPPWRCPALQDDLAQPSQATLQLGSGACFDQIAFNSIAAAGPERPVVLLGGRGWRAAPGKCTTDIVSLSQEWEIGGGLYGRFENLTDPSGCESWAAIFFARARPLYLKPSDFQLTQVSDRLSSWTPPPAPAVISVRTYFPLSSDAAHAVADDRSYSSQVFGESNRAGLDLAFGLNPGASCPATAPTRVNEVILCYVTGVGPEGSSADRRIVVKLGARKASTVAHLLGRALGLDELESATPGYRDNIMRRDAAKRGQRMTLGQVFRIHAHLSTVMPKCDPGPCPSPDADMP